MKKHLVLAVLVLGLITQTARAQVNLIDDGDFSTLPGSGTPTPTDLGSGSYQYVQNSGTATDVGGAGVWTFQNGSSTQGSAIYMVNTAGSYSETWIPQAAPSNVNGYVVQLDTISNAQTWSTGNAAYQTVTVTAGSDYQLTFSINTEHNTPGFNKNQLSLADVMVTNATSFNTPGSFGTVSTSDPNNLNAATYGNVTGYQYSVDTTNSSDGGDATTWQTYTLSFTATSSSVQIAIADDPGATQDSNSNIALEDVSLVAVPEPREWALIMLLGVAGLVVARKLRGHFVAQPSAI